MKHLGPSQARRWADHGSPDMSDKFVEKVISEVKAATHGESTQEMARRRDVMIQGLLALKTATKAVAED